jgi:predicted ATP-grasp superfamily ATP-dependent carboligase
MDGRIQSCLPVLKALRLGGHHVTIAESDPLCVGFFSRYPHRRLRHRDPRIDPNGFLSDLKGHLSTGEYDVLIPILDVTAELVSQHKSELERFVRIPLVDYPIFMRARDKSQTMKIAQAHGIPVPKTYFPEETDIEKIAGMVDYPLLIKPNISVGARGIVKVKDTQELKALYPLVVARYGPCTVQEFIPQTDLQYKAQFFLDRQGEAKAWVVYSKIRHFPLEGGVSTLNCTVAREDIASLGMQLLRAMNWYSYADIDLITDPRDGQIKIMEVNPRITGSVKICFEAGVDFAKMLVALAMGWKVELVEGYRVGLYLRHPGLDLIWFCKAKNRFKADPNWFRLVGRNLRYDVWSLADPGPMVAYVLANLRDLFSVEARRYKYQRNYLG